MNHIQNNKIGIGREFDDYDIKIYTPGDFEREDDSNIKIYPASTSEKLSIKRENLQQLKKEVLSLKGASVSKSLKTK